MKLNNLKPAEGSTHSRRRIGRGPGSGLGGTSTRGHKGAKARSGYKRKIGFEGGQMPLQRRVPKAGFKNINHKEYFAVNLSTLQALAEAKNLTKIGIAELKEAGLTNGKAGLCPGAGRDARHLPLRQLLPAHGRGTGAVRGDGSEHGKHFGKCI